MTGLPKHIIKKYGVSKKAWAVFRGQRHHKKRGAIKMPRRSRRGFRRKAFWKRAGRQGVSLKALAIPAVAYGAVRGKINSLLTPITSRVPFGAISDEVVLAGLAYFGEKRIHSKMAKDFLRAAFVVEMAQIGQALADGTALAGWSLGGSKSSGALF